MTCFLVRQVPGKERMSDFEVLVDSDAFVGLFLPDDTHHKACRLLFERFAKQRTNLVTTNYTVAETATVLSRRSGQSIARAFLDYIASGVFPIIYVDAAFQEMAISLFMKQGNKNMSLFDCANVAVMRNLDIAEILSFDQVYSKKFGIPVSTGRKTK